MPILDDQNRYGTVSIANHWIAAIAIVTILGLGLIFHELPRGTERSFLQGLHISIGVIAAPLIAWRIFWRIWSRYPEPVPGPHWQQRAAKLISVVLLAALAVLFITGPMTIWTAGKAISIFDWIQLASPLPESRFLHEALEEIHEIASDVLMIALAVHIVAAAKHAFIDRDQTIRRILRSSG